VEARLLILGEGEERARLETMVNELGLEDAVELPGFVAAVPSFIGAAAVVVMPSRIEGFGNALVEAMAGGVPVVATACPGGPADILDDGRYGPLVPVDDPEALAAGIAAALEQPVAPEVLQARAAEFSLDKIVARYLAVLGLEPNGR
jgi:glycosyltransferase involved in cell wall biosynthesis